ncbi:MAG: DUF748 domain-containing protein [Pseudomonadota bacterium]
MNPKLKKILLARPFKILLGLLLAYFLFAYFAVNPLAKRILPWVAENKLASHLTVDAVKFDPLRLIVTINNLHLTRLDGGALASFDRLYLNLEASGLFRFAWRLKDIRLTAPQINLDIAPNGKFNWADLIAKLNEDKKADSSTMARVLIDHILIERGNIQYTERNRPTPFNAKLQPLGLELEGLSTLPEDRGDYLIAAKLPEQGGTLKWKGDLALNPLASSGSIDVQGIKLQKLMQVVDQQSLPIKLLAGELETSFSYNFAMVKGNVEPTPQVRLNNLAIKLAHVAGDLNAQAKLALDEATVKLAVLNFSMDKVAQIQFQGLDFTAQQLALTQGGETLFKLPQAEVKGVDFNLSASQLKVTEVSLKNGEFNAIKAKDGKLNWQQLVPAAKQQATTEPTVTSKEAVKPFNFEIASLQLEHWQAAFQDLSFVHPLRAQVKDINLDLSVTNADGGIAINQLNTELAAITLQSALYPEPIASLAKISLHDGAVNLKDSTVQLPAITLSGLQTQVLRETNKPLNWQAALEPIAHASPQKPQESQPSAWQVKLDKLALENGSVHFADKTTPTPVILDVQSAALELHDTSLDLSKAIPIKAKLQLKQGGQLNASGKIALTPFKSDLQIKLDALSLKPFSPYINQFAVLKLDNGQASVHGKLTLKAGKSLAGQFAGGFNINNLAISDEVSAAPFLAWNSVSSDSLKLTIAPNQLHMDQLRIVQPVGKFIIYEDKTINVKRILRAPPNADGAATQTAQATDAGAQQDFPIAVDRISVENADLEFADLSLKPQFGTYINTLTGVINGLSNNPAATAQVELDGKVDEFGSARIRGSVQPFRATDFTDLKLSFHNLEMNRLTPYSGKFAGRKIDSGKLSVDLEYKIKQRQLAGENKFVINQLKLGDKVDSADATNLPLDLAIALLEDSDGLIDLDLPISGSLDDPQFSYGKIIWKAIVNVLGKIVTSPFHALGKLLGISPEKAQAIRFDAGQSVLKPEEQEKLTAITGAMAKRPSLSLIVMPSYNADADKAALAELATRRSIINEMGLNLKEGEQPGPIDLNNQKVQSAIENLLKDHKGEGRSLKVVDKLKNYFKKSKPEDLTTYTSMLEQLQLYANISEADLTTLAKARATAIQSYLLANGNIDASRLSIAEVSSNKTNEKDVSVKLSLGLAKNTTQK